MGTQPEVEITTFEAAQVLKMSTQFLSKKIEAGALPIHVVDDEPRLWRADVLNYRDRTAATREAALQAMTTEAEELGLYDE